MTHGAVRAGGLTVTGLTIEQMNLSPLARQGAERLLAACPSVVFTSGRRDRWGQAWAMASNIVKGGRDWIACTYKASPVAESLQTWVTMHPEMETVGDLAQGLTDQMVLWSDAELRTISRHCSGDAFDILPMVNEAGQPTPEGQFALDTIGSLEGLERLLTREGGLVRWHVQFIPSAEV